MRILFVTSTTFSVTLIVQLLQDIAKEHLTTNSIIEMTPVSLKLVVVNFSQFKIRGVLSESGV